MTLLVNIGLLLLMSTLWSVGIVLIKIDVVVFPPVSLAAWRATIASAAILALCLLSRRRLGPAFRRSGTMLILAVVGIVGLWVMLAIGEESIGSGMATLLVAVTPPAALIVTALPPISGHVRWQGWAGVVIAAGGLVLAIGPGNILHAGSTVTGVGAVASGFFLFGVYCVLVEKLTKGLDPVPAAGVSILYAGIIMWVLAFTLESPTNIQPSTRNWITLFTIGLLGTAVPNLLVYVLARRAGGIFVSFYGYVMPIIGIILAYVVFDTQPEVGLYAGLRCCLRAWGWFSGPRSRADKRAAQPLNCERLIGRRASALRAPGGTPCLGQTLARADDGPRPP